MELRRHLPETDSDNIVADSVFEEVNLESIASFRSGEGISVARLSEQTLEQPVPVYGGNGIAGYTDRPTVTRPTIVIGRVGQRCGEVYLTTGPAWITDNALYPDTIFRDIDIQFLGRALQAGNLNASKNRNDLPLITQTILKSIRIRLPRRRFEQQAIAAVLSDADALIESLERLLAKKRQLKHGAMQELLTGRRRLPGFWGNGRLTKTAAGLIPTEWNVRPLACFINSLQAGVSVNSTDSDGAGGEASILKTSCVSGGHFIPSECKPIIAADLHRAKLNPRKDTILVSRMNTPALIGECAYVDRNWPDLFVPDRIWMTRHNAAEPHSVRWLAYLLSSSTFSRVIKDAATGTSGSMKNISKKSFLSLRIPQPSFAEQQAIAEFLSDLDREIAALGENAAKVCEIKEGMVQQLLTGRIRLVDA
ncbi:MAG TPA: restriction endonuclease subunit S, partial [Thermoanaerobaculia bacterium]